ncbi:uncharacterized protein LOC103524224 isoform X1 [Diaphorina citri]|uniref:Uncharacterized protein LOC103524224 isoform X1 n=1 Tax=Diaphorina citri TaxID=121845 RepID=A0A3Q0JPG5_DIACI|nr:uncharacterized protein LOC103524224 isoform X1 [Diaphorina citri]
MRHARRCMLTMKCSGPVTRVCLFLVVVSLGGLGNAEETTTPMMDNYQFIMSYFWQWPTYPPDWPPDVPTTTFVVPVISNPSTPFRILKLIKDNDEEMDALEARLEAYKQFCELNKTEIEFMNRTRWSLDEAPEYFSCLADIRARIKLEKQKFRNGTYLLRDIKEMKKKVRSTLVKIAKAKKKFSDYIPEFTFQTRRAEYFQLVEFEKEAKKVRKVHKLRMQLLTKYHKYYLKHYKPTSTRGPIQYEHLPRGLQELVDAGKFNITGIIRPNYITRKVRLTTNLEAIFHNITTKKWKRLTGPELEEAMQKWNRYTPHIYYRKFKTTTPWSITVAVKREMNRRKYERMMNNLKKRIAAGETTRKLMRWMQAFRKNTPVRKHKTPKPPKEVTNKLKKKITRKTTPLENEFDRSHQYLD